MKHYDVTILISAYNAQHTIKQCIESIKSQTSKKWCVYLIDDASVDETWSIILDVCRDDPRFKLYRNALNLGLTRNLQKMVSEVETKYIARLDADDIYMPTKIEKQLKFMEKNLEYVMCATGYNTRNNGRQKPGRQYENVNITRTFYSGNQVVHGTVMFRKDTYLNYRHYFKYSQDYDLWLRLVAKGEIGVINERLYTIRISNASISSKYKKKQSLFAMIALNQCRKHSPQYRPAKIKRVFYILKIAIRSGNLLQGLKLVIV